MGWMNEWMEWGVYAWSFLPLAWALGGFYTSFLPFESEKWQVTCIWGWGLIRYLRCSGHGKERSLMFVMSNGWYM